MNESFYLTRGLMRKSAVGLLLVAAACGPRVQRVDDSKLAGVPADRLGGVNEAKTALTEAKAEFERAKDAAAEAEYRVRIVTAALRVAEATSAQHDEELALAKFKNATTDVMAAGEAQRDGQLAMRRAKSDVDVAQAALAAATAKIGELEKKVRWLEAKHEHERAKVALRYDQGSPNEKSAQLNSYERAELAAQLAWKEAEGAWRNAVVALDDAKQVRGALEAVK